MTIQPSLTKFLLQIVPLLFEVVDAADAGERLLRDVVVNAVADAGEGLDGLVGRHVGARTTGEFLGHVEVLAEELLDAAGAVDGGLVLFRKLVDTNQGDDVLQLLVTLQNGLDTVGAVVVGLADVTRIKDSRGGAQRVDGRVDALGGDVTGQLGGSSRWAKVVAGAGSV